MKSGIIGLAMSTMIAVGAALSLPSCGHQQKLVSITVSPASPTFGSTSAPPIYFTATGTYIHPPETKDITGQVAWATDVPEMLTLTYAGAQGESVAPNSTNNICGIADLSATAPEGTGGAANIVVGYATVTVDGTAPNCPGTATNGVLVVTLAGTGIENENGAEVSTVSSSPAGINCPNTSCGAVFPPPDNVVTLTANPGANTTFAWTDCPSQPIPTQCIITVPGGGFVNVIANFTSTGQ